MRTGGDAPCVKEQLGDMVLLNKMGNWLSQLV